MDYLHSLQEKDSFKEIRKWKAKPYYEKYNNNFDWSTSNSISRTDNLCNNVNG